VGHSTGRSKVIGNMPLKEVLRHSPLLSLLLCHHEVKRLLLHATAMIYCHYRPKATGQPITDENLQNRVPKLSFFITRLSQVFCHMDGKLTKV
jgi:hypothetical protein